MLKYENQLVAALHSPLASHLSTMLPVCMYLFICLLMVRRNKIVGLAAAGAFEKGESPFFPCMYLCHFLKKDKC